VDGFTSLYNIGTVCFAFDVPVVGSVTLLIECDVAHGQQ
jgi:hypothetical protein